MSSFLQKVSNWLLSDYNVKTDKNSSDNGLYQLVKLELGDINSFDGPVSSANPLPVTGTVTSTPSGTQDVNIAADAVGLATSALQTSGNALLTTIDADTSTLAAVDFATQTTLAAILSGQLPDGHNVTVDNATLAVTQSGTWNITNISGTISLPTGAATEATLATLLTEATFSATDFATETTLSNIDTNTGLLPNAGTVGGTTATKQTLVAVGTSSTTVVAADATRTGFLVRQRTSSNVYFCMEPATIATTSDYRMKFQGEGIGCTGADAQLEYRAITDAASSKNVEVIEWYED